VFEAASHYSVHVLTGTQRELSDRFARVEREVRDLHFGAAWEEAAAAGLRGDLRMRDRTPL